MPQKENAAGDDVVESVTYQAWQVENRSVMKAGPGKSAATEIDHLSRQIDPLILHFQITTSQEREKVALPQSHQGPAPSRSSGLIRAANRLSVIHHFPSRRHDCFRHDPSMIPMIATIIVPLPRLVHRFIIHRRIFQQIVPIRTYRPASLFQGRHHHSTQGSRPNHRGIRPSATGHPQSVSVQASAA